MPRKQRPVYQTHTGEAEADSGADSMEAFLVQVAPAEPCLQADRPLLPHLSSWVVSQAESAERLGLPQLGHIAG